MTYIVLKAPFNSNQPTTQPPDLGTDTESLLINCISDRCQSVFVDRPQFTVICGISVSPLVVHLSSNACTCARRMSIRWADDSYPDFGVSRRRFVSQHREGSGCECGRCSEYGWAWSERRQRHIGLQGTLKSYTESSLPCQRGVYEWGVWGRPASHKQTDCSVAFE